ncbi:MAG: glutamate-1-semialdehyde-2,1-aminomutase [Haliscomenobacteraceae bacterium CHB4]|nr:Glutamate-1-semialdehyde 2,1-aminomutase [Saprospiraceae bacterium]MCE7926261.1 glutamate-1-semialdehyde-2,1-aminomutase [Haliscomenobacteraceae bacterium CHB4]
MNQRNYPTPSTFTRSRSGELFEEAKRYFPGGVHSPVRAFKSVQGPPIFFQKGEGCHLYDVDGQAFVDFCCSWGPLILGHCPPAVVQRVQETVANGMSFGTPTPHDNLIGKLILDHHRYVEMIRFVSSGTEAVMSAIRLARGVTGRSKVIKFEGCYHGHVDSLLVKAGSGLVTFGISTSAGIPESFAKETIVVPLADPAALESALRDHAGDVACVIVEPVPANNGLLLQDVEFLQLLRNKTREHGVLLIFDEVISGFRVGFEGAAGYYGIQPDILTFGKIIGGGMPVGAYAASREIMEHVAPVGPVYQAGTLSANPVAMAAGFATLTVLLEPGFYENLAAKTQRFTAHLQDFCNRRGFEVTFPSIGSIFWPTFTRQHIRRSDEIDGSRMELFKKMHLECLKRGVYFGPSGYEVGFVSAAHMDADLDFAAEKICESLDVTMKGF